MQVRFLPAFSERSAPIGPQRGPEARPQPRRVAVRPFGGPALDPCTLSCAKRSHLAQDIARKRALGLKMPRATPPLPPRLERTLANLGQNIRLARLRRLHSAELVAERAGISRNTLTRPERGDPAVALGIFARILLALRLDGALEAVARDDEFGRKLQDLGLTTPKRVRRPRNRDAC